MLSGRRDPCMKDAGPCGVPDSAGATLPGEAGPEPGLDREPSGRPLVMGPGQRGRSAQTGSRDGAGGAAVGPGDWSTSRAWPRWPWRAGAAATSGRGSGACSVVLLEGTLWVFRREWMGSGVRRGGGAEQRCLRRSRCVPVWA